MTLREWWAGRKVTRFERWAFGEVIVLQVALTVSYLVWVYSAGIGFLVGVPIFTLLTFPGWTPVWAVVLGTASIIAGVGSTTRKWEALERWAGMVASMMMLAYVIGLNSVAWIEGDMDRAFIGGVAIAASILPWCRFVWLALQAGKIRVPLEAPTTGSAGDAG